MKTIQADHEEVNPVLVQLSKGKQRHESIPGSHRENRERIRKTEVEKVKKAIWPVSKRNDANF
jgi:hypothetical protein